LGGWKLKVQLPDIGCEIKHVSRRRNVNGATGRGNPFKIPVTRFIKIAEEIGMGYLQSA
jgi:hypothetical protein